MARRTELVVIRLERFGERFDGHIAGALERLESGGALRVAEALVVGRTTAHDAPIVLRATGGTGGLLPQLTTLRLGSAAERAAAGRPAPGDAADPAVQALAQALDPGAGLIALRIEHRWATVLDDALARAGAEILADDPMEPEEPANLVQRALDVARRQRSAAWPAG